MIDQRFARREFDVLADTVDELKHLTNALEREIKNAMEPIMFPLFRMIIARLNSLGHELREYEGPKLLDYAFRDDREEGEWYSCKLRIGFDGCVFCGFGDTGGDGGPVSPVRIRMKNKPWSRLGEIDDRFSADAFAACGLDTLAARQLADTLETATDAELHDVAWPTFRVMIHTLNGLGHNLRPYVDIRPCLYQFRDDLIDDEGYHCRLRASFDYGTIAGYFHPTEPAEREA